MRDWRKMAGALCIVLAMVLGAFAGFVYARDAGLVGASPAVGARGEDRRLASAFDQSQTALAPEEVNSLANGATSLVESNAPELVSPDGLTATRLTAEDRRDVAERTLAYFETKAGSVTVQRAEHQEGTRYSGAGIDAGGPYGGPDVFEGTDITITVTIFDPTLLFLRYDFNGDGVWDFPDPTGGGPMGVWTTQTSVTLTYNDNVFGDLCVEAWDGVSTTVEFNSGDNLAEQTSFGWFIGYGDYNFAWQFQAKSDLVIRELGHYHYVYDVGEMALWDEFGNLLGECEAMHNWFEWNWCTLPSAVSMPIGAHYRVAIRITAWETAIDTPSDTDQVHFEGTYYCYGGGAVCFPDSYWTDIFIPLIDFRWTETIILPDAARDCAFVEVNNVAPTVFGVLTNPDPGLEGTPTEFSAYFEDPGLDDTWEFRWTFHDGEVSPWVPISKYDGGARVLFLHTWSDNIGAIHTSVAAACGIFCVVIDEFDYGPLGQDRAPALSEVMSYDLLIVGTNYFNTHSEEIGDLLADYMDQGGNVLMMQAGFDNTFGDIAGVTGRWEEDQYSPLERGFAAYFYASLGTIWQPGHPFFDGVASLSGALRAGTFSVTPGAEQIADWDDGFVLAATKLNPMVDNGALACALNIFPYQGWTTGDWVQMIANAIRFCSQQPDPTYKTMPLALDPYLKAYGDDEPTTTTPQDSFSMTVEVRDDDHGRMKVISRQEQFSTDFEDVSECSGYWGGSSTWPAGWSADPDGYGWVCSYDYILGSRGPNIWYYYNDPLYGTGDGHSYLYTGTYDFSGFSGVQFNFYTYWQGDYPFGSSDGYVEASVDGGASWPVELYAFHHNDPGSFQGDLSLESTAVGGSSDVVFRFRYESADDWWWMLDNVQIVAIEGEVMNGLGSAEGIATIANVAPTSVGGFSSALRNEADALLFKGFTISDPALIQPTEWFAFAWDFDDGTAVDWTYVGSLAPPRFDVLVVHTICLGLIDVTCPDLNDLTNKLLAQDDVGSVTTWDFINYPALPTAPTTSYMLQFDVIIVATNWAYFSYAPFDLARRQVGDNLAAYIDAGRGGAVTMMCVYCTSGGNDLFSIRGRYMDDDYGPYERANYLFPGANGITLLDPSDDLFVGVSGDVGSLYIHDAKLRTTVGGGGQAAGRNGVELAQWTADSTSAVGKKVLNNGACTVHFGGFGHTSGSEAGMLLRNLVGCAGGGLPSPKIPEFTHTYGDNGIYNVDLMMIDDDMGYVWDFAANQPMEAFPETFVSHSSVEVAIDNVEPAIDSTTIEAFIAAQVCVRIAGTGGNSVTASFFTDGTLSASTTVVRASGSPNPTDEKCGLLKVDVLAPHTFEATLTYSAPMGGSNPTWLVIAPWRDPVSPGHGTVTYQYWFEGSGTTVDQDLSGLKAALIDGGEGARIDFVAEGSDPGTDDLAFFWSWGGEADAIYGLNPASVYTIHVHHNDGSGRTDGVLAAPDSLGFSEPYFDRSANDDRSPAGTTDFRVRDTAVHAFPAGQTLYYVFLLVLDDDNGRGYASSFGLDGIDIEVIVIDLG